MKLPAIAIAATAAALLLCQCALAMPHGQHHQGRPAGGFSNETARLFDLPEYDTAQIANQTSLQQIASSSRYANVPDEEIPPDMRPGAEQARRARIILDLSYLARELDPAAPAFSSDAFILKLKTEYADGRKYVNYYEAEQAMRATMSLLNGYGTLEDALFYDPKAQKDLSWCTREFLKRGKLREERARGLDGIAGAFKRGFEYEQDVRLSELELWKGSLSPAEADALTRKAGLTRSRVCDGQGGPSRILILARAAGGFCASLADPASENLGYMAGATAAGALAGFASGAGIASVPSTAAGALAGAVSAVADAFAVDRARRSWAKERIKALRETRDESGASLQEKPADLQILPADAFFSKIAIARRLFSRD